MQLRRDPNQCVPRRTEAFLHHFHRDGAELRYGAERRGSLRLTAQMEAVLGAIDILPFEPPADAAYGMIRVALERAGRIVGGHDLLIAAHAMALGCTIVTDNVREFSRIQGLAIENWLR